MLISSVISAKEIVNPPTSSNQTFATEMKYSSKHSLCLHVLLGVSLSFSGGFLAEPTISRMGIRPAFLSSGRSSCAGKQERLFFDKNTDSR